MNDPVEHPDSNSGAGKSHDQIKENAPGNTVPVSREPEQKIVTLQKRRQKNHSRHSGKAEKKQDSDNNRIFSVRIHLPSLQY